MNILQALDDPQLLGASLRDPASWSAWRAFQAALFALPMSDDHLATYRACTGRTAPPERPFNEAWMICGRRAGKSWMMATTAVYLAGFRRYDEFLAPGERATIMVIAADRKQARVIMRYIGATSPCPSSRSLSSERRRTPSTSRTGSQSR